MKAEDLFEVIGDIDDLIIEDTQKSEKQMSLKSLARWGALAACFVVVAVLSLKTFEKEKSIQKEAVVNITKNEETGSKKKTQGANNEITLYNTDDSVAKEETYSDFLTETAREEIVNENADAEDSTARDETPANGGGGGASGGGSSVSGAYSDAVEAESLSNEAAKIFGGAYINEKGEYVVVITDDTAENREILIKELGTENSEVVFRKGEYTLSYLTELQNKISTAMTKGEIPFVMTSSLMESENRIEVSVNANDESELDKVRQFDTLGGAIVFVKATEVFY